MLHAAPAISSRRRTVGLVLSAPRTVAPTAQTPANITNTYTRVCWAYCKTIGLIATSAAAHSAPRRLRNVPAIHHVAAVSKTPATADGALVTHSDCEPVRC